MTKRIYISQESTYKEAVAKNYLQDKRLTTKELDFGIAIPNGKQKGGIYDSNSLKLVATMDRENQKQNIYLDKNYKITNKSDESVIFGGQSYTAFGHLLLEGLSRLWYIIANPRDKRKIIYIKCGDWGEKIGTQTKLYEFFQLLGVDKNRIVIIEKPTKFKHITIPEVSIYCWRSLLYGNYIYTKEYPLIYNYFAQKANELYIEGQKFDKIYLSHSKWEHRAEQHFLNENIYEEFFKNRGYEIIYPEEYSVTQIAYLMNNAKEVATTMGSSSHLALFCKENTRFIILTRDCNTQPPLMPQCLINQAMKLDWFIINANNNYLPSFDQNTGWGVVNFVFTNDFKEFCKDYFGDDFSDEFLQQVDDLAYFKAWTQFYSNPKYYKMFLANLTPFDFVNKMSEVFFGVTLDKNDFAENISNTHKKRKEKWYKRLLRHLKTMKF